MYIVTVCSICTTVCTVCTSASRDLRELSRAPYFKALGRQKVEGSLIRLFKAKEGSRKHEAIRMPKYPRFANLA